MATITSQGWEATNRPWIRKSLVSILVLLQHESVNEREQEREEGVGGEKENLSLAYSDREILCNMLKALQSIKKAHLNK